MFLYNVNGKKFLSEEELAQLLSRSDYTHIKEEGEPGLGRRISTEEKIEFDNPWIDLTLSFWEEQRALDFARTNIENGLDGSYATVEKVTVVKRPSVNGYFPKERTVICNLKKENGAIVDFCKI